MNSRIPAIAFASLIVSQAAFGVPIYDQFGPLPTATFGGQGIPNEEVAISSQWIDGDALLTIAMSATQRYSNPAVTNDGAGTYFATAGANFGGNNESLIEGALWNFNYYLSIQGINGATPVLADYQIDLYYDFDTGDDTPIASLGSIDITAAILASMNPSATLIEDSQNLNFGFLAAGVPGIVKPPLGTFDPNALGEYNFGIQVKRGGWGIETVAMDVRVIPEPATMGLFLLAGLALVRRR
ncbi:MAG: PEP-CTERM sorting domain-containing protein [Phycisphaerales bacterium]|nr:PEP-CTERM sorting domain-containing protein [Phycisphaerales bacterium]MCB9855671.1 PEP-CTERM sorting domain-containing protein [Phycisphaerales bacterium]MCB9862566.1 PEP-CTERM sorting domain-containing protein [Phycisphaerales bacterium]